uniref:type I restriction enzyme endonuclease domain-containing protein n=1 Tax=Hydrotalea sp. TaxID=2881279 RepID=UPI00258F1E87
VDTAYSDMNDTKQVKTKKRVADHGEVFTSDREVNAMLDLVKQETERTTIDWTIKESVQSALRRNIRRILRLHGYPPDLQEKAVETVITQAKMLAEDLLNGDKEN